MENSLGSPVFYRVPNNFDVVNASINQGVPVLRLARSSNITKALIEIIQSLSDVQKPDSYSMIRRLFVRN